jgi:hypothetical protein
MFWGFTSQVISKTMMDVPAIASVADLIGMAAAVQRLQRLLEEEQFEVGEEDTMMNSFYELLDKMSTLDHPAEGDLESDMEPEECRRCAVVTDDDFEEQESQSAICNPQPPTLNPQPPTPNPQPPTPHP